MYSLPATIHLGAFLSIPCLYESLPCCKIHRPNGFLRLQNPNRNLPTIKAIRITRLLLRNPNTQIHHFISLQTLFRQPPYQSPSTRIPFEYHSRSENPRRNQQIPREIEMKSQRVSKSKDEGMGFVELEQLLVEETWLEALPGELQKPYAKILCKFVGREACGSVPIYPPPFLIFNALNSTPFDRVKAVIIGQVNLGRQITPLLVERLESKVNSWKSTYHFLRPNDND